VAQYPYLLFPELIIGEAARGHATLVAMLVALSGGGLIMVPTLLYLYALFQRPPSTESPARSAFSPSRGAPAS
jgi:cytochrome d ubiquinol oxidase subunit II